MQIVNRTSEEYGNLHPASQDLQDIIYRRTDEVVHRDEEKALSDVRQWCVRVSCHPSSRIVNTAVLRAVLIRDTA